jgi:hypothetical protein
MYAEENLLKPKSNREQRSNSPAGCRFSGLATSVVEPKHGTEHRHN